MGLGFQNGKQENVKTALHRRPTVGRKEKGSTNNRKTKKNKNPKTPSERNQHKVGKIKRKKGFMANFNEVLLLGVTIAQGVLDNLCQGECKYP